MLVRLGYLQYMSWLYLAVYIGTMVLSIYQLLYPIDIDDADMYMGRGRRIIGWRVSCALCRLFVARFLLHLLIISSGWGSLLSLWRRFGRISATPFHSILFFLRLRVASSRCGILLTPERPLAPSPPPRAAYPGGVAGVSMSCIWEVTFCHTC